MKMHLLLAILLIGAGPAFAASRARTGTVERVELTIASTAQLDALARGGFDLDTREGRLVRLYATPDEMKTLREQGHALRVLPVPAAPVLLSAVPLGTPAYHAYADLTNALLACASNQPSLCRLVSIGRSVQQRELWALRMTADPDAAADRPRVKIMGSIHGDEPAGMEVCLRLIDDLVRGWTNGDARITNLLATTELWIVPLLNPDGWAAAVPSRYNANGYDLNRSFPEGSYQNIGNMLYGPVPATNGLQPEVVQIMRWSTNRNFVLSVSLHGGALLVNYPYDSNEPFVSVDTPTPDDALMRHLALTYSAGNTSMWNSTSFSNGIVNGAAWYVVDGGMQDWNYRYAGCNEFTVEIGTNKMPPAADLDAVWLANRESLLAFAEAAHQGVRGVVRDAASGAPVRATIEVAGVHHLTFSTAATGDYQRLLRPGPCDVIVSAPGYQSRVFTNLVVAGGAVTRLDVDLARTNALFSAAINFQPATAAVPAGHLADTGGVFGAQASGRSFGWSVAGQGVVARDSGDAQDLRFDTAAVPGTNTAAWEIAVATGRYRVALVAGDPRSFSSNRYRFGVEGVAAIDGAPTASNRWLRGDVVVEVTDGRLTVSSLAGATNNRLAYLEVDRVPAPVEAWRFVHFGSAVDDGAAADLADPDLDGCANLLEYACGAEPTNAASVPLMTLAPTGFGIGFSRATGAIEVVFHAESSEALAGVQTWSNVATYAQDSGWTGPAVAQGLVEEQADGDAVGTVIREAVAPGAATQRFMRVTVSRP